MAGQTKIYYIQMGSQLKYGWRAQESAYSGIATQLGVKAGSSTTKGIVFGANGGKPPRVRINLQSGKSVIRFCSPDKMADVLINGTLIGKSYKTTKICSVSALYS